MRNWAIRLVLVVAAVAAAGAQAIPDWTAFRSPEGLYNAIFPGPPRLFAQEATTATGEKFPQYIATTPDPGVDSAYFVAYFDMNATQTYTLSDGRDGMVKAVKGTLIGESAWAVIPGST